MGSLDLSVVVPIFNEEEGILIFTDELRKNLETLNLSYEVLYINDGSSDATQVKIESIDWANLKHYEFQTNLGHMRALEAGMDLALGEMILTIDADLQHPPKYISEFIKTKNEQNVEVVYGVRDSRTEDGLLKRISAKFYYFLMKKLSGVNIRENAADFRLITKNVNEVLKSITDQNKIYRLLIPSLNFSEAQIIFKAEKRLVGKTKYSFTTKEGRTVDVFVETSTGKRNTAMKLGKILNPTEGGSMNIRKGRLIFAM